MKPRILLVNPWIYDFAAFDLWARPFGLFAVSEFLSCYNAEIKYIDCTGTSLVKQYGTGKYKAERVSKPDVLKSIPRYYKRYGIGIDEFRTRIRSIGTVNIVLMTSIMTYWYPGVRKATEIIREEYAREVPIVLGGIYPTLYPEHASRSAGADCIFRGNLDGSFKKLLDEFGVVGSSSNKIPYYQLGLFTGNRFAAVRTSAGCLFRCSYCASNLLIPAYSRREYGEVVEEIDYLYRSGIRDFAFYDDALLVDPDDHIKPMLRAILKKDIKARFHTPNGLHARFIDDEIAHLLKQSGFASLRLSLETIDAQRQLNTGNKIGNSEFVQAIRHLKQNGFRKPEIGVYLMYGLPGQSLDEVRDGIRFLKTLGVSIFLAEFSPIRGTRSWQELVQNGIINDDLDPILTNNTVFSYLYSGYDHQEVEEMKIDVKEYNQEPV